jgi:peptidoglycan-N-acetylglucosamine deacetylase
MKRAAITIDVDSLRCYREIHGLPPSSSVNDPVYTVALARFFELLEEIKAPATLFLIGADAPLYVSSFAPARALGCEIASHSYAHDYRLTSLPRDALRDDLVRAHDALSIFGEISGFRAPGYNTTPALFEVLTDLRYSYDSSRLPSPLYFLARAAAIRAYSVLRRPSRSLTGSFEAFAGSLAPHRVDGMLELPMACEPLTRVPFFGTSLTALPARARSLLISRAVRTLPYVNFEMHAIDLLDASETDPDLAAAQRDLRIPVREKMRAFRELFRVFRSETEVSTLRDIARAEAVL